MIKKEGGWVLFVACILLLLIPIWAFRFLPLNDYPNHLASTEIIKKLLLGDEFLSQYYTISLLPVPNSVGLVLMVFFSFFVSTEIAGKLVLSLYVIAFPLSVRYFYAAVDKKAEFLGMVALPFVFNWYFAMGFVTFIVSLPIFFFTFGYWFRVRNTLEKKEMVVLALLLALLYLAHLVSFVVFVFSYFYLSWREKRLNIKCILPLIPALLLCAWFCADLLLFFLSGNVGAGTSFLDYGTGGTSNLAKEIFEFIFVKIITIMVFFPVPFNFLFVFLLGFILVALIKWKNSGKKLINTQVTSVLMELSLIFFIIFLIFPTALLDYWQFAAERMLVFPILFLPLLLSDLNETWISDLRKLVFVVTVIVVLGLVANTLLWEETIKNYVSGESMIKNGDLVLPMYTPSMLDRSLSSSVPLLHAWGYYQLGKDTFSPLVFSYKYQLLQQRKGVPDLAERLDLRKLLAGIPEEEYNLDPCGVWEKYFSSRDFDGLRRYDKLILYGDKCNPGKNLPEEFTLCFQNGVLRIYCKT